LNADTFDGDSDVGSGSAVDVAVGVG